MTTIEQKIEALQLARERVASGGEFVCNMLNLVAQEYQYLTDACEQLQEYCGKSVYTDDGCDTLDEWISQQGYDIYGAPDRKARMVATRLAWIDWMIACYQEDPQKRKYGNDDAFALCG